MEMIRVTQQHDPRTASSGPSASAPRRRVPAWLRVVLPALIILVWFAGAGVGGPYFGKVSEVSSNDQTAYLPSSADATKVQRMLGDFTESNAIPAVVVFASESKISPEQLERLSGAVQDLGEIAGVADGVSP